MTTRALCIALGAVIRQMDRSQVDGMLRDIQSISPPPPESQDEWEEWKDRSIAADLAERFVLKASELHGDVDKQ